MLSTGQASNSLPWFFDRKLSFEGETISEVAAFLASCRYILDEDQFRRDEWWTHPAEFEELMKGDCEDHALWAWRVLHELGHDVRLMIGSCEGGGHAWVQLYTDGKSYILEATAKRDMKRGEISDYVPEHSFKRTANGRFLMFGHKPGMITAADNNPVEPLSLPAHWIDIDRLIFEGRKSEAHTAIRIALQGKDSHTRQLLDRYFYLREHNPESFKMNDEAYWEDWAV